MTFVLFHGLELAINNSISLSLTYNELQLNISV